MKIKGFLFDLDGVIVDTAVYHFQAWRRMANELGFDIDEEFNEKLKGISRMDSIEAILKHGNKEVSEEEKLRLATEKNEWYLAYVNKMTPTEILPGVEDFFKQFKALGITCSLGSASKNAPKILEKIGLKAEFDAIVDGNSVTKSKPNPEVFLKGAEALGLKNEECVVFEDAVAGVEAAKRANMKTVGFGDKQILNQADLIYNSFTEFTCEELLKKLT
jgi:beta-phosphoglucomutase